MDHFTIPTFGRCHTWTAYLRSKNQHGWQSKYPPQTQQTFDNTQQMTGISEGITLSQTTRTLQVQQRRSQCSQQVPELLVGVTPLFFTVQAGITSQARPLNDARSYILM